MYEWVAAGGVAGMIVTEQVRIARRKKKYRQSYRYIRILQHEDNESYPDKIKKMVTIINEYRRTWIDQRLKGREWFRLLFYKNLNGDIAIYLGFPEDRSSGMKNVLKNTYPLIEMHDEAHEDLPLHISDKKDIESGYFDLQRKGNHVGYALKSYSGSHGLEDVLLSMEMEDVEIWLDILFTPESQIPLRKDIKHSTKSIMNMYQNQHGNSSTGITDEFIDDLKIALSDKKTTRSRRTTQPSIRKVSLNDLDTDQAAKIKMMKQRFTGREPVFKVAIRLMAKGKQAKAAIQTVAANIRFNYQLDNSLKLISKPQIRNQILNRVPENAMQTITMTGDELANLVHLPDAKHRVMESVPYLKRGQRSLKSDELNEGISIGTLIHPIDIDRKVKIALEQMQKHFMLTGKTGSGKSSALMTMCQSLIDEWIESKDKIGFTFFDPAQDTVATILNRLMQAEAEGKKVDWNKIHYFDFNNNEYSLGLNLLYAKAGEPPDAIVERALSMITRIYGGLNAPRMERVIRNCLTTLVMDTEDHVVLGILPLLRDERFRKRVLSRITDATIKEFWKFEFPALEDNLDAVISPIMNRLSPFNTNVTMRRLFGQKDWNLPIRKWMDEGHIILFNLKESMEQVLQLAGEHIVNQYHAEFQGRTRGSKTHFVIWDEAHRTAFPIMEKMIAEDRKFGGALGLSTQYPEQLPANLLSAFKENMGNVFTTTLGQDSASIVAKAAANSFAPLYLQQLPERVVAVYTGHRVLDKTRKDFNKVIQTTFTVECLPPFLYNPDGSGNWVAHEKNERGIAAAIDWGINKGIELMARDTILGTEADRLIHEYLRPGTPYQLEKTITQAEMPKVESPLTTTERPKREVPSFFSKMPTSETILEEKEITDSEETGFDDLYDQAIKVICNANNANITLLQESLNITSSSAQSLLDAMESFGDISVVDEFGNREVYALPGASNKPDQNLMNNRWA